MLIFVKTLTGGTVTVEVERSDDVEYIKEQLQLKEEIPRNQMHIVCHGPGVKQCLMEPSRSLRSYNANDETYLHLHLRLRGMEERLSAVFPPCESPDGLLFPTAVQITRSGGRHDPSYDADACQYVQAVDALGSIDFQRDGDVLTLSRPAIGELCLRTAAGESHPAFAGDAPVPIAFTFSSSTDDCCTRRTHFGFYRGKSFDEVISNLRVTLAREVCPSRIRNGFNVYVTRPSGAEVLLDDASVLASSHNATRVLSDGFVTASRSLDGERETSEGHTLSSYEKFADSDP